LVFALVTLARLPSDPEAIGSLRKLLKQASPTRR